MLRITCALCLLLSLAQAQSDPHASLTVGNATARRGEIARGVIAVPAGSDAATDIPVIVVNGARPGPVLALVSGAHGTEYASIIALEKIADRLHPQEISGSVIIVPLVNVASFQQMTPHLNPIDRKSMNRFYPGHPNGTQTDRALYAITKQVVEPSDNLIDLHGGDLDENLRPYSYWAPTGKAAQDAASRAMALAFGLNTIIISRDRPTDPSASRYLETTASLRGKPSITAEAGRSGPVENADVEALIRGCLGVMQSLKMLPGAPAAVDHPVWIEKVVTIANDANGIFYPLVDRGARVAEGAKIGYLTDYAGVTIAETHAPAAGEVLFIRAVPTANKGDTLANIGVIAAQPPQ